VPPLAVNTLWPHPFSGYHHLAAPSDFSTVLALYLRNTDQQYLLIP
jgi:hypothetical protein